jgi:hypothetical protein
MAYDEGLAQRIREVFQLKRPYVRVMDFAKRPMKGYVFVDPLGIAEDDQLAHWVEVCYQHVRLLPVKVSKPKKT